MYKCDFCEETKRIIDIIYRRYKGLICKECWIQGRHKQADADIENLSKLFVEPMKDDFLNDFYFGRTKTAKQLHEIALLTTPIPKSHDNWIKDQFRQAKQAERNWQRICIRGEFPIERHELPVELL